MTQLRCVFAACILLTGSAPYARAGFSYFETVNGIASGLLA